MKIIILPFIALLVCFTGVSQTITDFSPSSADKGTWSLPITISGNGTSFSNATNTIVRISQGNEQLEVLSVNSISDIEVSVNVRVSNLKPTGPYIVEVYDSSVDQLIATNDVFTVNANSIAPSLINTSPESGAINQILPVTISLTNTHFAQATDNTIYLSQGTNTILPIPGSVVALNDNFIKASFDLNNPLINIGDFLNSHCGNSFDGYFNDNLSINITPITTISGVVIYGGVYNGVVELYQKNTSVTPNTYSLVATVNIDGSNAYAFNNIADASYLVRSVPINMNDVVATYFPNNSDWSAATAIDSDPSTSTGKDITPINSMDLNGGATINGAIGYGPNGFMRASITMAEGVEVFLKNIGNNTYAQTTTSSEGLYTFNNVPAGDYQIEVNIPGYDQTSSYDINIDSQDDAFVDLDFLIDNNEVFTSGFMSVANNNINSLTVYPNPTNGDLFVQLPEVLNDFTIEINNQLGQSVYKNSITGNNSKSYYTNITNVPSGIYFVTVQNNDSKYQIKVVKQ